MPRTAVRTLCTYVRVDLRDDLSVHSMSRLCWLPRTLRCGCRYPKQSSPLHVCRLRKTLVVRLPTPAMQRLHCRPPKLSRILPVLEEEGVRWTIKSVGAPRANAATTPHLFSPHHKQPRNEQCFGGNTTPVSSMSAAPQGAESS